MANFSAIMLGFRQEMELAIQREQQLREALRKHEQPDTNGSADID